jgi:hypothetical protein
MFVLAKSKSGKATESTAVDLAQMGLADGKDCQIGKPIGRTKYWPALLGNTPSPRRLVDVDNYSQGILSIIRQDRNRPLLVSKLTISWGEVSHFSFTRCDRF